MSRLRIAGAAVVGPLGITDGRTVLVRDGRIEAVLPDGEAGPPGGDEILEAAGGDFLAPGFIDLHTHGAYQQAFDRGREDLLALCRRMPAHGATGFLPTVSPRPGDAGLELLADLAAGAAEAAGEGTRVLGLHLEGPFLALAGALPPGRSGAFGADWVRAAAAAAAPVPLVFSVSPELPGAADLVREMAALGARAFITHTAATVGQTRAAMAAGARHATHFYDVFPAPPEPEPGVRGCGAVEAVLAAPETSVDFVLDGEHVDPVAVQLALACKGVERVCLITDSLIGAGLPPGRFATADGDVIERSREGAPARFAPGSRLPGGLYGSGLTMDAAVRNAVAWLGLDLPRAVQLASSSPARVLGLEGRRGRVAEGFDADLVLLDREFRVRRTWVGGRPCWPR